MSTKLRAPERRPGMIPRIALVERLIAGADRRLTLVCAPAGWGKTALLSEWRASEQEDRPFAWVQLDPEDDDPVRLWGYVIGALRTVEPEIGHLPLAALPVAGAALIDAVVAPLINDLAALSRRVVLVLDDYHLVRDQRIHESVAWFLRHLPSNIQLALASRADPPLSLGRLRAAQDVNELRVADLRFSDAEAQTLLNGSLGLELEPGDVALLQARTEGWAAGLRLSALSLRGQSDRHAFVQAFAGDDRQIVDYLHEIIEAQPAALREFLLQTSVLESMCAPLCDALTGGSDGRERLEECARLNLFVVALDTKGEWYRYHQLFRDLLRQELVRSDPEAPGVLHRRAAAWHRAHGDVGDAIAHATAAGDVAEASELIARHWRLPYRMGQHETAARWIDALPQGAVVTDGRLCLARGWTALQLGEVDAVESWAGAAERAQAPHSSADAAASMRSAIALLRATCAIWVGDIGRATEQAQVALALDDGGDPPLRGGVHLVLGVSRFFGGAPEEAADLLRKAVAALTDPVSVLPRIASLSTLALVLAESGEVAQARSTLAEADRWVGALGLRGLPPNALVQSGHGRVLELSGDLAAAEAAYERAVALARVGQRRLELAQALLALASLRRRRGGRMEARAHAREARAVLATCPDTGVLADVLARTERALQLRPGSRSERGPIPAELSERELDVLRLLASARSQREIAAELYVSFDTVKSHARSIFRKLGVERRADAVARGRELALL